MASLGWGRDAYGTGPYGSTFTGVGVSFVSALATSSHTIRVTLSGDAMHITPALDGDATNPATWVIQRLDTAAFYTPIAVTPVTPAIYDITVLEALSGILVTHRISSTTLLDAGGNLTVAPRHADFAGLLAEDMISELSVLSNKRAQSTDLANPPAPRLDTLLSGGTLRVNSAGDYVTVTGAELVRKLVIRRLISVPGDFFHLPNYGVGIKEKEPVPVADLVQLKSRIEFQVKKEPEILDALASITLDPRGILTVQLRAKLKSGEQIDTSVPLSTSVVM